MLVLENGSLRAPNAEEIELDQLYVEKIQHNTPTDTTAIEALIGRIFSIEQLLFPHS